MVARRQSCHSSLGRLKLPMALSSHLYNAENRWCHCQRVVMRIRWDNPHKVPRTVSNNRNSVSGGRCDYCHCYYVTKCAATPPESDYIMEETTLQSSQWLRQVEAGILRYQKREEGPSPPWGHTFQRRWHLKGVIPWSAEKFTRSKCFPCGQRTRIKSTGEPFRRWSLILAPTTFRD